MYVLPYIGYNWISYCTYDIIAVQICNSEVAYLEMFVRVELARSVICLVSSLQEQPLGPFVCLWSEAHYTGATTWGAGRCI